MCPLDHFLEEVDIANKHSKNRTKKGRVSTFFTQKLTVIST